MATLKEEQKRFIVMQLGMMFTPQQVAALVRDEYDIDVPRQQVNDYNPEAKHKAPIAKKWRLLHKATRDNYLNDQGSIPIAHQAYRLRLLDDMARESIRKGNTVHAAAVVQQAAKEVGRVYTARHAYPGKGRAGDDAIAPDDPSLMTDEQLEAELREVFETMKPNAA